MDTSIGKRNSGAGTDGSTVLFAEVPEVCWHLVSSYITPPDAYNLALSSKHFFGTMEEDSDDEDSADTPLLATRLLRESLISSLARVLKHSESGITLEAALSLGELPEGSALIAGSTMVQACLGVLWERPVSYLSPPDVDIYASAEAARSVRSWLVERANCMFIGFNDGYMDLTDQRLAHVVDSYIHHVELWGSVLENIKGEAEDYGGGKGSELDSKSLKDTEYYKQAAEWGKDCHTTYAVDWKWRQGMSFDLLGVDMDGDYSIRPKPGGDLPFNFYGDGNIDLIVAQESTGEHKVTPFDLLDDFDLTICKCSFDGKKFHIPDPHLTFNGKSTMETARRDIVESYLKHFPKNGEKKLGGKTALAAVCSTVTAVKKDVPVAYNWFFRHVDVAEKLPDRHDPDAYYGAGNVFHDPIVKAKLGLPLLCHNWIGKLVNRLHKYQQRGVEMWVLLPLATTAVFLNSISCSSFRGIPSEGLAALGWGKVTVWQWHCTKVLCKTVE